ncbi:MAG: FkbM family methyltransferase [Deltaproteobacteria bacterium]|nr:FkbM family methyltransferase [Deltaproteobacteria bacterium]
MDKDIEAVPFSLKEGYKKLKKSLKRGYKKSYSQSGEDTIVALIFGAIRIKRPSCLDIGAHDPVLLNNTYLFYERGSSGVNIEPNPILFKRLESRRRRDVNLNAGVAASAGVLDFYVMTSEDNTLHTFSKETAERYSGYGTQAIKEVLRINTVNVNDVMREYFSPKPNFVSMDIEGLEMEVLRSFDFKNFRPEVFCIETILYTEDGSEGKVAEIIDFMKSAGYMVFADTYINTIFVDSRVWKNRPRR